MITKKWERHSSYITRLQLLRMQFSWRVSLGSVSLHVCVLMATDFTANETLRQNDTLQVLEELLEAQNHSYTLGLRLGLSVADVERIHSKSSDSRERLLQIVVEFLKGVQPRPTWRVITEALRSPAVNLPALAQRIAAAHFLDRSSSPTGETDPIVPASESLAITTTDTSDDVIECLPTSQPTSDTWDREGYHQSSMADSGDETAGEGLRPGVMAAIGTAPGAISAAMAESVTNFSTRTAGGLGAAVGIPIGVIIGEIIASHVKRTAAANSALSAISAVEIRTLIGAIIGGGIGARIDLFIVDPIIIGTVVCVVLAAIISGEARARIWGVINRSLIGATLAAIAGAINGIIIINAVVGTVAGAVLGTYVAGGIAINAVAIGAILIGAIIGKVTGALGTYIYMYTSSGLTTGQSSLGAVGEGYIAHIVSAIGAYFLTAVVVSCTSVLFGTIVVKAIKRK